MYITNINYQQKLTKYITKECLSSCRLIISGTCAWLSRLTFHATNLIKWHVFEFFCRSTKVNCCLLFNSELTGKNFHRLIWTANSDTSKNKLYLILLYFLLSILSKLYLITKLYLTYLVSYLITKLYLILFYFLLSVLFWWHKTLGGTRSRSRLQWR